MTPRRLVSRPPSVAIFILLAATLAATAAAPATAGASRRGIVPARAERPVRPPKYRLYRGAVAVARTALRPVARRLPRVQVIGAENLSAVKGSAVLAANHISGIDPIAIALAAPRRIRFYAKAELFRVPVFGRILTSVGAVPIDRGHVDFARLNEVSAGALAEEDGVVGVFTEGTLAPWSPETLPREHARLEGELARDDGKRSARRTKRLERKQRHLRNSILFGGTSKTGAARQAVANDRPIVPVVVLGTRKLVSAPSRFFAWLRGVTPAQAPPRNVGLKVIFGEAIMPPTEGTEAQRVHALRDAVDEALRALARPHLQPGQDEVW